MANNCTFARGLGDAQVCTKRQPYVFRNKKPRNDTKGNTDKWQAGQARPLDFLSFKLVSHLSESQSHFFFLL